MKWISFQTVEKPLKHLSHLSFTPRHYPDSARLCQTLPFTHSDVAPYRFINFTQYYLPAPIWPLLQQTIPTLSAEATYPNSTCSTFLHITTLHLQSVLPLFCFFTSVSKCFSPHSSPSIAVKCPDAFLDHCDSSHLCKSCYLLLTHTHFRSCETRRRPPTIFIALFHLENCQKLAKTYCIPTQRHYRSLLEFKHQLPIG